MGCMYRRSFLLSAALLALLAILPGTFSANAQRRGRKYKAPPETAKLVVTVLRADDGEPIENAAVIFHTLKDPGNMELKSNEDGKAMIDVLPIGETARIQIIAKGFRTFGQDYPVDQKDMAITIRMKRPGQQYSIYENQPDGKKDQNKNQDDGKKPNDNSKPNDSSKPQQ